MSIHPLSVSAGHHGHAYWGCITTTPCSDNIKMQGIALSGPVENTQHGRRNEMEDDTVSHVATKKRIKKKVFRTKKKKKKHNGGSSRGYWRVYTIKILWVRHVLSILILKKACFGMLYYYIHHCSFTFTYMSFHMCVRLNAGKKAIYQNS